MKLPFFKKSNRIKRLIMRKIRYEDFVDDVEYDDENVDEYDDIVVVTLVVEVTMFPTWRQ